MSHQPLETVLVEVMQFACEQHRDQRRKDAYQSPYINHAIETLDLLVSIGRVTDAQTIAAAVLHDTLEETPATAAEIERRFGAAVRRLVEEVTDQPGSSTEDRRRQQLARIPALSDRARLIRLADKTASLVALPATWEPAERRAYLVWMGEMAAALKGTNPAIEAVMADRLKQAWTTAHHPPAVPPLAPATCSALLERRFAEELARLTRRLQSQLSSAEELSDTLGLMLTSLGVNLRPAPSPPGSRPASAGAKKNLRRFQHPAYIDLARNGIGKVTFAKHGNGPRLVSFDDAPSFALSRRGAELLEALAGVPGCAEDGFVPFVSHATVADALEKISGRRLGNHAMVVALGRLQAQLVAAHWSPKLIESRPRRGVRLRLRRHSDPGAGDARLDDPAPPVPRVGGGGDSAPSRVTGGARGVETSRTSRPRPRRAP